MDRGTDSSIFLMAQANESGPDSLEPDRGSRAPTRWLRAGGEDRPDRPRHIKTAALVVAVLASLALVLRWTGWPDAARRWLDARDDYRVAWDQLVLAPAPPAYIRSGSAGLLLGVQKRLGGHEALSTLAQDWDKLAQAFPLGSPWVEEVHSIRVEGYPSKLTVALVYRQPVAVLAGPGAKPVILDRHGVVLPTEDTDTTKLGQLVRIEGWKGSLETRPGVALTAAGSPESKRLLAATRLAAFACDQSRGDGSTPVDPIVQAVNLRYGEQQLMAQTREGIWVLWGQAPGQEPPGDLAAEQKWVYLRDWLARTPTQRDSQGSYLFFNQTGIELKQPRRSSP